MKPTLRARAARGVAWSGIENGSRHLLSFAVYAALARFVHPGGFGLVALAGACVAFLQVVLSQGFSTAIIRRTELQRGHLDSAFWTNLAIAAVLFGATQALAGPVARMLGQPGLAPVLRALSIVLPLAALSVVQTALLVRSLRFRSLAARTLVSTVAGAAAGIGLAVAGAGVWSLVAHQVVTSGTGVLCLWWASDYRPGRNGSRRHLKDLFGFSLGVTGHKIVTFFSERSDEIAVGTLLGPVALGYYAVARKVVVLVVRAMTTPPKQVALPVFARMQEEPERLGRAFTKAFGLTALISFPAFAGIAAVAPDAVRVLFGDRWAEAAPLLTVLSLYGLATSASCLFFPLVMAVGRSGAWLALQGTYAAVAAGACFLGTRWGAIGVAWAMGGSAILFAGVTLLLVHRLASVAVGPVARATVVPAAGTGLMFVAVRGLDTVTAGRLPAWAALVAAVAAGAAVYVAAVLLLSGQARAQAAELVRRAKNRMPSVRTAGAETR